MLELFSFFAVLAFFLLAVTLISAAIACVLGYYVLALAEHMSGRQLVSGMPRLAFCFLLGIPVAYLLSAARQYGPFFFILSVSFFLAAGVYVFLRVGRGAVSGSGRHSRLRKASIIGFEEEKPVKRFKLREKEKVPLKLVELDGDDAEKRPEPEKEGGGIFGFLEGIPNPLKGEGGVEKAAKEFVLTRFGEKGSVERTWEKGGKVHAVVRSSGGRYTLTLNSSNTVVDWDKE